MQEYQTASIIKQLHHAGQNEGQKSQEEALGPKSIEDVSAEYPNDSVTEEYLDCAVPLQVIHSSVSFPS